MGITCFTYCHDESNKYIFSWQFFNHRLAYAWEEKKSILTVLVVLKTRLVVVDKVVTIQHQWVVKYFVSWQRLSNEEHFSASIVNSGEIVWLVLPQCSGVTSTRPFCVFQLHLHRKEKGKQNYGLIFESKIIFYINMQISTLLSFQETRHSISGNYRNSYQTFSYLFNFQFKHLQDKHFCKYKILLKRKKKTQNIAAIQMLS